MKLITITNAPSTYRIFLRKVSKMKEGIHPTYEPVTYIQTDGSEHVVRMSYTKEKVMTLQVDNLSHPAYTGKQRMLDVDGRQAKFDKKYGRK